MLPLTNRLRRLSRSCGWWATARNLYNRGYELRHALTLLGLPVRPWPDDILSTCKPEEI